MTERKLDAGNTKRVTPLHLYALEGKTKLVEKLLQHSPELLDLKDVHGYSALHYAAKNGHLDVVKILIHYGGKIDSISNDLVTPLHFAANSGNSEVVEKILQHSPELLEMKDINGWSALFRAATYGHLEVLETLINSGAKIDTRNRDDMTILHAAAIQGELEVVDKLLKLSPDLLHMTDFDGYSALHFAAQNGHLDVVKKLISHEANVDSRSFIKGSSPLHIAAWHGHCRVVEELLQHESNLVDTKDGDGHSALHLAAENGHLNVVKILINHSATVISNTMFNCTPLHFAANHGHSEVAEKLLQEAPILVDMKEIGNLSALHLAAENGFLDVVEVLIKYGAEIDSKAIDYCTPLHYAAFYGKTEVAERLLKERPDLVSMKDIAGNCAFHRAAQKGYWNVAEVLMKYGAAINCKSIDHSTPLHIASGFGHSQFVEKILTLSPCSVDMKDVTGESPLFYAAQNGHLDIVKILVEHGASVSCTNKIGNLAIHTASKFGHSHVVLWLLKYLPNESDCSLFHSPLNALLTLAADRENWTEVKELLKFGNSLIDSSREGDSEESEIPVDDSNMSLDRKIFMKQLDMFLACLHGQARDSTEKWISNVLKSRVDDWHKNVVARQSEQQVCQKKPLLYCRPDKRREAVTQTKSSVQRLELVFKQIFNLHPKVVCFIFEQLDEIYRTDVMQSEIGYLLLSNKYSVEEREIKLLRIDNSSPSAISVTYNEMHVEHVALVFLNTCEPHNRAFFKEREQATPKSFHQNMLGYKETLEDEHHSIIIIHSAGKCMSLEEKLSRNPEWVCENSILVVFKQLVSCLDAIHNEDFIHCAIKPTNIFIRDSNYIHIGDLSSAIFISDDDNGESQMFVNKADPDEIYAAPEMLNDSFDGCIETSADIWSLGCVLYRMITLKTYNKPYDLKLDKETLIAMKTFDKEFVEQVFELLESMLIDDNPRARHPAYKILSHRLLDKVPLPKIKVTPSTSVENEILGQGAFGMVVQQDGLAVKEAISKKNQVELEDEKETITFLQPKFGEVKSIIQAFQDDSPSFKLKMEYCEFGSLQTAIDSSFCNLFSSIELATLYLNMSRAVEYLHKINLVHRDIKPGNFVLTIYCGVKLIDYGLAKVIKPGEKLKKERGGTVPYMAPEVFKLKDYGKPADVYSLGCVFYEVLTMRRVYDDMEKGTYEEEPDVPGSAPVVEMTRLMLSDKPYERPEMELVHMNMVVHHFTVANLYA